MRPIKWTKNGDFYRDGVLSPSYSHEDYAVGSARPSASPELLHPLPEPERRAPEPSRWVIVTVRYAGRRLRYKVDRETGEPFTMTGRPLS